MCLKMYTKWADNYVYCRLEKCGKTSRSLKNCSMFVWNAGQQVLCLKIAANLPERETFSKSSLKIP